MNTKSLLVILFLLVTAASFVFVNQQRTETTTYARTELMETPTPTPIVPLSLEPQSMDSPNGKTLLTMERDQLGDEVTYAFYITLEEVRSAEPIFLTKADAAHPFSIPFNTWEPEQTHFFIKQAGREHDNYFVFHSSGEPFGEEPYFDVQKLFTAQVEGFTITDVTGWAAPKLLLVNAVENEGEQQVSFWFDVTSSSFIRLGTYFR